MGQTYHVAFGVYGIIGNEEELVVIRKTGGPYINRYDLPGGSLEDGEPIQNAIVREIKEETGLEVTRFKQLGTTLFRYPWNYLQWHLNQHICVFYNIQGLSGEVQAQVAQFPGQDLLGARTIRLEDLTLKNASPLVLKAKEYLLNGRKFDAEDVSFDRWQVLTKLVY